MIKGLKEHLKENRPLFNVLRNRIKRDLIIPCYHVVKRIDLPHIDHLYTTIDVKKFINDLDFYEQHFNFLNPTDLLNEKDSYKNLKGGVLLTFDDGYKEIYEIIYPILKEKGIPAIFFITTDFVNNKTLAHFNKVSLILDALKTKPEKIEILANFEAFKNQNNNEVIKTIKGFSKQATTSIDEVADAIGVDYKDYLASKQPYVTEKQIIEMHNNSLYFGAHSSDHQAFSEISYEDQAYQIRSSISYLESILNSNIFFFAFPYSSIGADKRLINEFDNILFFDTLAGFHKSQNSILQRFIMDTDRSVNSRLVELVIKKCLYNIKFKKAPSLFIDNE